MDPISQAIILGVAGNFATDVVKATYNKLKNALTTKYGVKNKLTDAVEELEGNPNSEARQAVVREEVKKIQADKEPELLKLAQDFLNQLKEQPGGIPNINMTFDNVKFAAASGTGNATISQVNDNTPFEDWKK